MTWKKYILIKLFIVTGFSGILATPRAPDRLVYNGDTIYVYLKLLPNEFYRLDTVKTDFSEYINRTLITNLFGEVENYLMWDYRAMWEIVENQLYLTGIFSPYYYSDSIKADLTLLFKEKVINGKVKAEWINSDIIVRGGKELTFFYIDLPVFKNEIEFVFLEGELIDVKTFDNSKSRRSIYSQNDRILGNFIYTNIDWDNLPKQEMPIVVNTRFSANEDGKIDEVVITIKSNNEIFNQEAVRVIKLIPDWDVIFLQGQLYRKWFNMPIKFSEENREKYGK